ncbi:SGNH/GDSL hydrolase family protein [Vibrio parahaemolyticus]|uniref:SGNH/GDSL hydrolase family protein n=1 Tax=Vibrio parahaemolyticus TaxID=670 RepID=UPI00081C1124|nr:SGNH/GDSL hydrolase family protein [Vibrio parahaemolyticus]MCC3792576.1 SGNH/GDSL hydrolase family protein [Vibrio parahaemolyticus]
MKKAILLVASALLFGCNDSSTKPPVESSCEAGLDKVDYLITGQSNAMEYVSPEAPGVNWSYFEEKTGFKTYNIAVGGKNIDWLRRNLDKELVSCMTNLKGVLYIHGEADAVYGNPKDYKEDLRIYMRNILDWSGADKVFVSSVGYRVEPEYDTKFDGIRDVQYFLVDAYENWFLAFDDARYFRGWGMLDDQIHFNEEGDQMMMDAFAESIWVTQGQ